MAAAVRRGDGGGFLPVDASEEPGLVTGSQDGRLAGLAGVQRNGLRPGSSLQPPHPQVCGQLLRAGRTEDPPEGAAADHQPGGLLQPAPPECSPERWGREVREGGGGCETSGLQGHKLSLVCYIGLCSDAHISHCLLMLCTNTHTHTHTHTQAKQTNKQSGIDDEPDMKQC